MEKLVKIGNVEKVFRANGATPIKYRNAYSGADFFKDVMSMRDIDENNLTDQNVETIEKVAFVMCEDSNKPGMTFERWLEQFELFDLIMAIPSIIEIITGNLDTQNITDASKNAGRAES